MYSGSDSNESQKFPPWSLNPSAYQNMSNEQVDWAALAQQWIIMKEAGPPPVPGGEPRRRDVEAGEAPMDVVDNEKDEAPIAWNVNEPPPPPGAEPWTWNAQNQNWSWNNSWVPTPTVVPPPPPSIGAMKAPLLPTPNNMFNAPPESASDNAVHFGGYTPGAGGGLNNSSSSAEGGGGYWTASGANATQAGAAAAAAAAMKHIKPHNKRYSKVNVPVRVTAPLPPATTAPPVEMGAVPPSIVPAPPLDAAKRKQLPAWIREGLEKMEKDKLRQMEREKQKREREEMLEKNKEKEQETMEILKSTIKERQKSRFESDGENSEEEPVKVSRSTTPEGPPLTQDELMLKVRRTMTEVLLNVTSRLIESVCREEHQRYLRKQKASDQRSAAPRGGANISARLGLGAYGEDSEASSQDEDDSYKQVSRDSDEELKDTIKRKIADFQKVEREIEDKLEETERKKPGSVSRSSTPDSVDNDSQVDARMQDGKHQKSPPPKAQEKPPKNRSPSYSDSTDDYSKRSRSSSSDSNDSYRPSKKKYKSNRSKSRTPERRRLSSSSSYRYSKSPARRRESKKKSSRRSRSRSRSYSRSRRSRSSSYRRSKRSRSRKSRSRSRYSSRKESSRSSRRRRSRSDSAGRGGKRHRH